MQHYLSSHQRRHFTPIHCADLRPRAANETWTQQIERIQRSALEKAVSVVNRMISSAEQDPNIRGVASLPSASDDGAYDGDVTLGKHVKINIRAKTSVLQAVIVRAASVLQRAVFPCRNEPRREIDVTVEQSCLYHIAIPCTELKSCRSDERSVASAGMPVLYTCTSHSRSSAMTVIALVADVVATPALNHCRRLQERAYTSISAYQSKIITR